MVACEWLDWIDVKMESSDTTWIVLFPQHANREQTTEGSERANERYQISVFFNLFQHLPASQLDWQTRRSQAGWLADWHLYLYDLLRNEAEWRDARLVILGNGRRQSVQALFFTSLFAVYSKHAGFFHSIQSDRLNLPSCARCLQVTF